MATVLPRGFAMHQIFGLDFWITSANLLYLASYSVRDILWLRILTIVAGVLLIPYYYLQSKPLWIAISWNLVFVGINLFWVARLLLERRSVQLTEDEQRLIPIRWGADSRGNSQIRGSM